MIVTKSQIDFSEISSVCEEPTKLPYEKYKDKFKKIAFDVYAPINDPTDNLWTLQDTDDGEFLIRTNWDHDTAHLKESQEIGWSATPNKEGSSVTLYYKDLPLINLSADEYGFEKGDTRGFVKTLLNFMRDKNNVAALLKTLPEKKAALILQEEAYSDLKKKAGLTAQSSIADAVPYIRKMFDAIIEVVADLVSERGFDSRSVDSLMNNFGKEINQTVAENPNETAFEIFTFIREMYLEKIKNAGSSDVVVIFSIIIDAIAKYIFGSGETLFDMSKKAPNEIPKNAPVQQQKSRNQIPLDVIKTIETMQRQLTHQFQDDDKKIEMLISLFNDVVGPTAEETAALYPGAFNEDVLARVLAKINIIIEHGDYDAEEEKVFKAFRGAILGAIAKFKSQNALAQDLNQYKYMDALNAAYKEVVEDQFYEQTKYEGAEQKTREQTIEDSKFIGTVLSALREYATEIPGKSEKEFVDLIYNIIEELNEIRMRANMAGQKRRYLTRFINSLANLLRNLEGSNEEAPDKPATELIFGEEAEKAAELVGEQMAQFLAEAAVELLSNVDEDKKHSVSSLLVLLLGMAEDLKKHGMNFEEAVKGIQETLSTLIRSGYKQDSVRYEIIKGLSEIINRKLKERKE